MKKTLYILLMLTIMPLISAQDIPQHISYTHIYDFLDEMTSEGFTDMNTAVKPYCRNTIATHLLKIKSSYNELNSRQKKDLDFYLNDYALELGGLPKGMGRFKSTDNLVMSLFPPTIYFQDKNFSARMRPLIGMQITGNASGNSTRRWYGAEFQSTIGNHLSVYGSLRDISHQGELLSKPLYLNDQPGYQYTVGTDYSDSRGGIKYANRYISIGLMKDHIVWGDNYHGSNILSGRTPSIPMIYFQLKPTHWFELNYFHGWLVSNVADSSRYYTDSDNKIYYRQANKFIAANLLTFKPIDKLRISIGNSIVYAESNVIPAYFMPIAFYKSIDHTLTKGILTENQNSQLFLNISSRNINHLHLYASVFIDEVQFGRFLPNSEDRNPISYKVGAKITNLPIENLSLVTEYTKTNILNYKHSIATLTWASNDYNLGHYLGDNSDELYLEMKYKPVRGLDLEMHFLQARHGNEYSYFRRGTHNGITGNVTGIISQPSLGDVIWKNKTFGIAANYELFSETYAILKWENSNIQAFDVASPVTFGEIRMSAQETLNRFTPMMLQGRQNTFTLGLSFGF